MKVKLRPNSFLLVSSLLATGPLLHAQTVRSWNGATTGAWTAESNWIPGTNFAGDAPLATLLGEGLSTDIMTTVAANAAANIGINMSTLAAAGGVGLSLGGIDYNKTNTTNLQIGNSSTTVNGILRLNGATINSVANTLIRVAGSANLTIANVNTGATSQTMGLQLGITNGIFDVDAGRSLTISSNVTELNANSVFTKTGTGVAILGGTNSYTGGSTVSLGTLSFRTIAAKSVPGTHTFAAGTVLGLGVGAVTQFTAADIQNAFAGTFTGNLAGISIGASNNISIDTTLAAVALSANIGPSTRGLEKILLGQNLTVTGANQYSGRTVVNGGSGFSVNDPGNVGDASSNVGTNSTIDLMTGSFFTVLAPTAPVVSNRILNVAGATAIVFAGGTGVNTVTLSGNIDSTSTGTKLLDLRTNNTGANTFSGVISDGASGTLNLRKSNAGTWVISGPNTHTGTTTVAAGTLTLGNSLALQNSTLDTSASIAGSGTAGLKTTVTTLTLGGLTNSGVTKNLAALFTTASGGYGGVTALALNPAAGGSPSYSGIIADGATGMTLTKTGLGTQTLSGANTYTGATTVSQGTLLINGATSTFSTVSVAPSAILGGTGTIGGAVNVSGSLSPGASIETLGTGALSFAHGSTLMHELDSSVATAVGSDLLKVTGDLNLTGTVNLTLSDFAVADAAFSVGTVFSMINYTGSWNNGLFTIEGNEIADEEQFTFGFNIWKMSYNDPTGGLNYTGEYAGGSDSFVNLIAVPEPRAALVGGLGLLALLRRRRQG